MRDFGGGAFPEPPKGEPGGIRSAARQLDRAHDRLHEVAVGLHAGVEGMAQDWNGDAAGRYRLATQGLARAARAAAGTFADCSACVGKYADALEKAQDGLEHLRTQYDAAKQRAADAAASAMTIGAAMAMPDAPDHLAADLTRAQTAESDADGDADRILQRAQQVLDDFHDAERDTIATLTGRDAPGAGGLAAPFGGGVAPARGVGNAFAPGFGVPLGGLDPFNGLIRVGDPWNNDVPGFSTYWDGTHPSAEPVDDLTIAITAVAGGVGISSIRAAASELAGGLARTFGIQSAKKAGQRAGQQAFDEALALGRGGSTRAQSFRERLQAARQAGTKANAEEQLAVKGRRALALEKSIELAEKLGVKLPMGTKEVVVHAYRYSTEIKYKVLFRLLQLRAKLETRGAAGAAAAKAIDDLIGAGH